jgi:hypothetical protein
MYLLEIQCCDARLDRADALRLFCHVLVSVPRLGTSKFSARRGAAGDVTEREMMEEHHAGGGAQRRTRRGQQELL